jgi:hypothetical protein
MTPDVRCSLGLVNGAAPALTRRAFGHPQAFVQLQLAFPHKTRSKRRLVSG